MLKINLFCVMTAIILLNILSVYSQSTQSEIELEKSFATEFVVGPSAMRIPQGFFLLIRKGQKIGAIRFTYIERRKDGLGKASYESYFQSDGSFSFDSPNVRKQTGEINVKPLKGFHPLAFQFGKTKVRVGEWAFEAATPRLLFMFPYGRSDKDYGYEFAPTSAQNIEEIDASDKGIRWFKYDDNSSVKLSVSDIPK